VTDGCCAKFSFIFLPNTDEFYRFYISQGSVATQLRCDGMFSNHIITDFSTECACENFFGESVSTWQRYEQKFAAYFWASM